MKKGQGVIQFEAALKQSTPGAKPLKFAPEGDCELTLEVPASEVVAMIRLVGLAGVTFRITMEVEK